MLTEEILTYILEPIFGDKLHWDSPIIPLIFIMFLLMPAAFFLVKSVFFSPNSDTGSYSE